MTDFNSMTEALVSCDAAKLTDLVNAALSADVPASKILNDGLIAGMDIVGEKMESGDMFIPEVLMAAQAMGECVEILKPMLGEGDSAAGASVIIGTVKGDLHDIGKNLVAMMMESAGLEVHNIGVDISPEKFIEEIKAKKRSNCLPLGSADNHHAGHETNRGCHCGSGPKRPGQNYGGRCARNPGICRSNRCRRICRRCRFCL